MVSRMALMGGHDEAFWLLMKKLLAGMMVCVERSSMLAVQSTVPAGLGFPVTRLQTTLVADRAQLQVPHPPRPGPAWMSTQRYCRRIY
jgi:hypothetical protein